MKYERVQTQIYTGYDCNGEGAPHKHHANLLIEGYAINYMSHVIVVCRGIDAYQNSHDNFTLDVRVMPYWQTYLASSGDYLLRLLNLRPKLGTPLAEVLRRATNIAGDYLTGVHPERLSVKGIMQAKAERASTGVSPLPGGEAIDLTYRPSQWVYHVHIHPTTYGGTCPWYHDLSTLLQWRELATCARL